MQPRSLHMGNHSPWIVCLSTFSTSTVFVYCLCLSCLSFSGSTILLYNLHLVSLVARSRNGFPLWVIGQSPHSTETVEDTTIQRGQLRKFHSGRVQLSSQHPIYINNQTEDSPSNPSLLITNPSSPAKQGSHARRNQQVTIALHRNIRRARADA